MSRFAGSSRLRLRPRRLGDSHPIELVVWFDLSGEEHHGPLPGTKDVQRESQSSKEQDDDKGND